MGQMSESGKVSLPSMTPQRKEEIKRDAQDESETIYRNCSSNITNIELLELLAALEESQQQNARWKETVNALMMGDTEVQRDLVEAQQTIARQSEALGWYELGKPELARAALGNKEGSDKA
jgi:hypothetical protein